MYYRRVEHNIFNKNVKENIKIVAISDIHYSKIIAAQNLLKIYFKILKLKPNYICIVGDLIDSTDVVKNNNLKNNIIEFIENLSSICPVIVSLGNHDFIKKVSDKWIYEWNEDFWDEISSINNVTLADNKIFKDENILISGYTQNYDFYYKEKKEHVSSMVEDLKKYRQELINPNGYLPKICMVHSPYRLLEPNIIEYFKNYDIILSGHMHEGMVPPIIDDILKNNIGLIAPARFLFPKNSRGTIIRDNDKYIIISGGITKIGEESPRILHSFNFIYPISIEDINLINDEDILKYKRKVKYEKNL